MRKKFYSAAIILALILAMLNTGEGVQAASKKEYIFPSSHCTKFVKSNGRLKVEAETGFYLKDADGYRKINKQKLNIPLAKNCKWSQGDVGVPRYSKMSYKKIKSCIEDVRARFLEDEFPSPPGVHITVKNGKVIWVNLLWS